MRHESAWKASSPGVESESQHLTIWNTPMHERSKVKTANRKPQTTGAFLAEVVQTYRHNFWLFFKISAPATIISTLAYLAARAEVREIFRPLPRGPAFLVYRFEILKIVLCNYSSYVVSWIAFCFSFAAICTAVQNISAGSDIKPLH